MFNQKNFLLDLLKQRNLTNEQLKRYQTILDNLLDISANDSSVFTKINETKYFDINKSFGPNIASKIINEKDFAIVLNVNEFKEIIEELKKANSVEDVEFVAQKYKIELTKQKIKELKSDFKTTKTKLIDNIESKSQKSSVKWKLLLNEAKEMNSENNVWPMHIGFLFVNVNIDGKQIFAPLFLKEVTINISSSIATLKSNGELKINEKLLWILNSSGFDLSVDFPFSNDSIGEFFHKISNIWSHIYDMNFEINQKINKSVISESEKITFHGGLVLGLYQPLGGYARNRMIEIIKNDDMDNIFNVEFNKNKYDQIINESIFKKNFGFYKIVDTNYSQDKAVVSALNQDTIIWGPPGTGKSQTIVNIVANILAYGKTALVVSEKKAALEVIQNRIKSLGQFCLFILNDKEMRKKNFYVPIVKYIENLETLKNANNIAPIKIISDSEKEFVNILRHLYSYEKFDQISNIYNRISKIVPNPNLSLFQNIQKLDSTLIYPDSIKNENWIKEFYKLNKVNFFVANIVNMTPKQKLIKSQVDIIKNNLADFPGQLNSFINEVKDHDIKYFEKIILSQNIAEDKADKIYESQELSKMVLKTIFTKVESLDKDSKIYKKYISFASAARLANMQPHKFIKEYLDIIKLIYPVIVTTPNSDLSGWEKEEFDYAISDESSQIFIEKGIPILYLAKHKILAGDDQQMKPTRWFSTRSIDESVFGNVDSLLDYAISLGVHRVLLDKNYRSKSASLMTFSSKHFYKSSLDVVDSFDSISKDAIEVIQVEDGIWEDGSNPKEAAIAIQMTLQNLDTYEKIIILTFNAKQANLITTEIFNNYPELEAKINDGSLMLRNIENIQGDEADLIIATLVYDKNSKIHSTYVGRPGGANALNVAISRAREKMIVIKSIYAEDLKNTQGNDDMHMFRNWLKFLELSKDEQKNYVAKLESSQTQNEVIDTPLIEEFKLTNHGNIKTNFSIGTMQADIANFEDESLESLVILDDYDYAKPGSDYEDYIKLKDRVKFLRSKQYPTSVFAKIRK
ncbi:superfamily I DNA and/or RNA helicase [Mycoplasma testudineum]|uniref:Superfamily I DNA and/or RNA helicase n=1 Tax=Mycoplasma testudineum TaxID=244584 RepID=A0A4R6IDX8_9MOLU|nr:DEAD/DEAH box helicase [Mycoplasma testudineum]OYD26780.1 hypothetical protein CG473_02390 [Mycoplasma testudineum]TDO19916.1 superfamily I DNA and/or RNA helicase [Mycoplasma testudineum]